MSVGNALAMVGGVILVVLMAIVTVVNGTGFSDKTLFDWLGILVVPIAITAVGYWLEQLQRRRDARMEALREEESNQDAILQAYLDQMRELLTSARRPQELLEDTERTVLRARTLTVLARLDAYRKGAIVRFLYEAQLISAERPAITLAGANLSRAFLRTTSLRRADLSRTTLNAADLQEADLAGTRLRAANLMHADLRGANLMHADLRGANLTEADLREAELRGADLGYADLSGANLGAAIGITNEELEEQAASLAGAIMPDRSRHL